jgi:hypothetical protein
MNDRSLERVLDNMLNDMNSVFILLTKKIEELEQDLIEVEKLYEQVKSDKDEAFEKGFDEGVKHINQLIMRDERFPF